MNWAQPTIRDAMTGERYMGSGADIRPFRCMTRLGGRQTGGRAAGTWVFDAGNQAGCIHLSARCVPMLLQASDGATIAPNAVRRCPRQYTRATGHDYEPEPIAFIGRRPSPERARDVCATAARRSARDR